MTDNQPRRIAITGCSGGIGKAAALALAQMGHSILMLVRDSEKSREAHVEIQAAAGSTPVSLVYVDLALRSSARRAARDVIEQGEPIDVLVNNAGVFRRKESITPEGLEISLAVNFVAPALLSSLLLPLVRQSGRGRIVNVVSELYKKGRLELAPQNPGPKYNGFNAYANAKLLAVLHTLALSARLKDEGITVNCVHPGVVGTDVFRDYPRWLTAIMALFLTSPERGAKPLVHLAVSPEVEAITGAYFYKEKERPLKPVVDFARESEAVFAYSESLLEDAL